jgi:fused signal recognition particle receptor
MISIFKKWIAELKDGPVDWDALEATLIQSDLGVDLTHRILEKLRQQPLSAATIQQATATEIRSLWKGPVRNLNFNPQQMNVWLVIGVNGAGKTTTIAKLAHLFKKQGAMLQLIAADTFRAAAIQQLQIWAERIGIHIHCGKEGGDPSAAVYEGIEEAKKNKANLVIIDTAGRLHNKENLLRELDKMKRVLQKQDSSFPQEILLIIDAHSGMNAILQAKEFQQSLGITGAIVTKLDSSAKGGMIAALKADLNLETFFIGVGEGVDDLDQFDPDRYVQEFFELETEPSRTTPPEEGSKKNKFFGLFSKSK